MIINLIFYLLEHMKPHGSKCLKGVGNFIKVPDISRHPEFDFKFNFLFITMRESPRIQAFEVV